MGALKPQFVANLIVETGSNFEFRKLEDVAFEVIKNKVRALSDEQVWDFVEQHKKFIATELFLKENEGALDGISLNFDLVEEDSDYYIKFVETPEINLLRRLQVDTPENFERFCSKILEKLGGKSQVSGGPNDGGIDFLAFDLRLNNLPSDSTKGSRIFVIGQAKRYIDGNHVREKELREFVGSSIKKIDELKKTRSEQFGIFQPTILAFWTTSDFHINAKNYAKELGIWHLNGTALCQLALRLEVD